MSIFEDDVPALSPVQFFGLTADSLFIRGSLKLEKNYLLAVDDRPLGRRVVCRCLLRLEL